MQKALDILKRTNDEEYNRLLELYIELRKLGIQEKQICEIYNRETWRDFSEEEQDNFETKLSRINFEGKKICKQIEEIEDKYE